MKLEKNPHKLSYPQEEKRREIKVSRRNEEEKISEEDAFPQLTDEMKAFSMTEPKKEERE